MHIQAPSARSGKTFFPVICYTTRPVSGKNGNHYFHGGEDAKTENPQRCCKEIQDDRQREDQEVERFQKPSSHRQAGQENKEAETVFSGR
jgi:hypothetical protein